MENADLAAVLRRMGTLLEIQGANPFRVRAYDNAARTLEEESRPIRDRLAAGEDLTELPGIGKEMAAHLAELVATGRLGRLAELAAEIPETLVDVVALSGVGPKRARRLWEELGVETVEDLRRAAEKGEVSALAGFGAKSEEKILRAIERRMAGAGRYRLSEADRLVQPLVAYLEEAPGLRRLEVGGSYRRRKETVGDLDLLAVAADPHDLMERFTAYPGIQAVLMSGSTRGTVRLATGIQVDLRVVPAKSWGAALVYFTGNKAHNIKLRQRAIDRGLRLSEYGVFRLESEESAGGEDEPGEERDVWAGELVAGKTEKAVYAKLGLPWIPPELREDRGEIAAAEAKKLPRLVELGDLEGDLQMHSNWSDGKNTIAEMVAAAAARGYGYVALTDHSPALAMIRGLDRKKVALQRREIDKVQKRYPKIRILKSLEVDILKDGTLDMDDETLAGLDLVVAAIHSHFELPAAAQTARLLRAVEHPEVDILAHPTARRLGKRDGIRAEIEEVLEAAREHGVAMELNAHPGRLDLRDTHLIRARELGVKIVISTDAHAVDELDLVRYGVEQARRAWLTKRDVLNTLPLEKLLAALRR